MRPLILLLLLVSLAAPFAESVCVPRNTNPLPYLQSAPGTKPPAPGAAPASAVPGAAPASAVPGAAPASAVPGSAPASAVPGAAPAAANPGSAAVKNLCNDTEIPELCIETLTAGGGNVPDLDRPKATLIHLTTITTKVTSQIEAAKKYMAEAKDPNVASCLKDCLENYDDGMEDVETAKTSLAAKDLDACLFNLGASISTLSCDEYFGDEIYGTLKCPRPSPTWPVDELIRNITSNTLSLLQNGKFF